MIATEKHSTGLKASRYAKDKVDVSGDIFTARRAGKRQFKKSQILMETETDYYFSPVQISQGIGLVTAGGEPGWSLMTRYVSGEARGRAATVTGRLGFGAPIVSYADVDRALNVMQDMGRWDVAFRMVMDLFGVAPEHVRGDIVVWETFPHKSKMLLKTSPTTGVYLGGAAKDVVENWWAYCGGYHAKNVYLCADYAEVMAGVRNPFVLAGVDLSVARETVAQDIHLVVDTEVVTEMEGDYRVVDGVLYRPDHEGVFRPWWYTTLEGEPCARAWDEDFRRRLAGEMNLPILVRRLVDQGQTRLSM